MIQKIKAYIKARCQKYRIYAYHNHYIIVTGWIRPRYYDGYDGGNNAKYCWTRSIEHADRLDTKNTAMHIISNLNKPTSTYKRYLIY